MTVILGSTSATFQFFKLKKINRTRVKFVKSTTRQPLHATNINCTARAASIIPNLSAATAAMKNHQARITLFLCSSDHLLLTYAFQSTHRHNTFGLAQRRAAVRGLSSRGVGGAFQATVFHADGDDSSATTPTPIMSDLFQSDLANFIPIPEALVGQAWLAPLARLAAGYSPGLKIEDIESISVLEVQEEKLDIEAVVCEVDGCVSLKVPLNLPKPCNAADDSHSFEQCILGNLEELDKVNQENNNIFATEEEVQAAEQLLAQLKDSETTALPDWWVHPGEDIAMAKQCDSLRGVLNEADFHDDVLRLAQSSLGASKIDVAQAAVVAVGPAGLVVRAVAAEIEESELMEGLVVRAVPLSDSAEVAMVEVSIQFASIAADADSLQLAVLDTVEQL